MKNNKQKNFAEKGAVLGVKGGVSGKVRMMGADGSIFYAGDGEGGANDTPKGTNLTGVAGVVAAGGNAAAAILSAISQITNKHTVTEEHITNDTNVNITGSQSLDVNAKKWIGIAAASAAVIIVAMILVFRKKN